MDKETKNKNKGLINYTITRLWQDPSNEESDPLGQGQVHFVHIDPLDSSAGLGWFSHPVLERRFLHNALIFVVY